MSGSRTSARDAHAAAPLRAGIAKREITIEDPAIRVHDPLWVKALVLDDGASRIVIVTMDVTSIGGRSVSDNMLPDSADDFMPRLRERLEKELGIPGERVMVNASHTHPPGKMLCDDEQQLQRTFDAIREAGENLVDVVVGTGVGREDRISINRNLRLSNGKHWTIRHANPCPPDEEVVGVGPIDADIGILRVDRTDGTPLALVYNFACHLMFGDAKGQITANFTGVASDLIEETLGHGAMAFFIQGAAGDIIDIYFKDLSQPRDMEALGHKLGRSTLKAWRQISTGPGCIGLASRTVQLPRRTDIPERIEEYRTEQADLLESLRQTTLNFKSFMVLATKHLQSPGYPMDYSYRYLQADQIGDAEPANMDDLNRRLMAKYVQNIHAMEKLARIGEDIDTMKKHKRVNDDAGSPTIDAELQAIRVGDFVLVTAPIEVLTEVSLNVKRASPYKHTFVAGFTNGYMHYGPPVGDYAKGGYEVNECLLAPEWQAVFETTVADLIAQLPKA